MGRLNNVMDSEAVAGCAYGHASMFHIILGAECPPVKDGFSWDWQGQPSDRMPRTAGDAVWALRRGMLNEGIDLMGSGGMVSSAHSEADIDNTVQAFTRTVRQMKEEKLL